MKKFTKMLALCLALAMVFGMSVSAATNPSVVAKNIADVVKKGTEVQGRTVEYIVRLEESNPENGSFELTERDLDENGCVWFRLSTPPKGMGYVLYHFNEDGTFSDEVAVVYDHTEEDGSEIYYAKPTKFSPFVLVLVSGTVTPALPPVEGTAPTTTTTATGAPVSPKTGETLPVAGMMAVLCLAGVVVCAKKARCNG